VSVVPPTIAINAVTIPGFQITASAAILLGLVLCRSLFHCQARYPQQTNARDLRQVWAPGMGGKQVTLCGSYVNRTAAERVSELWSPAWTGDLSAEEPAAERLSPQEGTRIRRPP